MQKALELTIIIAARNASSTIAAQLDALCGQLWDGEWNVVVVDNGSTDNTALIVADYATKYPMFSLASEPLATNAGAVRNFGVTLAQSTNIAMCDADDVVGPHWVAAMGEGLRNNVCVTGPLDVKELNPEWLSRTRGIPSLIAPMTFHDAFTMMPAGNFGMRRALFTELGGFDETMRTHEDADLSFRCAIAGHSVAFDPVATVAYRYRGEPAVMFRQARAYGRHRPLVARKARSAGMAVPRLAGWRSWFLLVAWLPRLRSHEGRASYLWVLGARLGILLGCVRARTLYL